METQHQRQSRRRRGALETFLGGMETRMRSGLSARSPVSLKPSLVEWKPAARLGTDDLANPLETFLGGMETAGGSAGRCDRQPLKPSLVEWKLAERLAEERAGMEALKPSLVEWKQQAAI